jgi:hypothetical protein
MKKITSLLIALLLMSTTVFISCKKKSDNNTPPSLQLVAGTGFVSSDVTVKFGNAIKFKIEASATSGNLTHFTVQRASTGKTKTAFDTVFSSSSFSYILQTFAAGKAGTETWTFTIYDENGNTATKSLVVTTTSDITYGPVSSYSSVILGSWQNYSVGSAFASSKGLVYKMSNAKNSDTIIDWLYYYLDVTHPATITAPNDTAAVNSVFVGGDGLFSWAHRNNTKFKKVTDVINFGAIQNDSVLIIETQTGVTASSVTSLSVNDVLAFTTEYGKVGLIKINAINPGTTGTITFDVIVQKTGK